MPPLTRLFLRTALAYLLLGLLGGTVVAGLAAWGDASVAAVLQPTVTHMLTVGWLTQLIFGVAHWMFPRAAKEAKGGGDRGIWLCYGLLNAGLALRLVAEPARGLGASGMAVPLIVSGAMTAVAALLFAAHAWPRVRGK